MAKQPAPAYRPPDDLGSDPLLLRLGALGFGGPVALAGEMRRDLMERLGWVSEAEFVEGRGGRPDAAWPPCRAVSDVDRLHPRRRARRHPLLRRLRPPAVLLVTAVAAFYVAFEGLTWMQALFYGIGPAAVALILVSMWGLMKLVLRDRIGTVFFLSVRSSRRLRTEIAALIFVAGLVGIFLYARPRPKVGRARAPRPSPGGHRWARPCSRSPGRRRRGSRYQRLAQLGLFFFKAGAFTFGSGLAIMPFMQEGLVDQFHWLTERQFLDTMAVSMITPGPVVIGATFPGYIVAGVVGAAVAYGRVSSCRRT